MLEEVNAMFQCSCPPSSNIWAIEGNICSGKSTLCNRARDEAKFRNVPLNVVTETANPAALKLLYGNPKKYAFWYQTYMLSTRMHNAERAIELSKLKSNESGTYPSWIFDRSVLGDYVFAIQNYLSGNISEEEFRVYDNLRMERGRLHLYNNTNTNIGILFKVFANLCPIDYPGFSSLAVVPTTLIYLDCDPKECHRRLTEVRSNEEESTVSLEYIDNLDNTYVNAIIYLLATSAIDMVILPQKREFIENDGILNLILSGESQRCERKKYPRRPNVRLCLESNHPTDALQTKDSSECSPAHQCPNSKLKEKYSSPRSVLHQNLHSGRSVYGSKAPQHDLPHDFVEDDGSCIIPCYVEGDNDRLAKENFLGTYHTSQWRRQVMNLLSLGKDIILSKVSSPELEFNLVTKSSNYIPRNTLA